MLKRIDARRKEHIKQRNLDSKRLLQRNRNVQTVLESKQNVEGLKLTEEIKKARQRDIWKALHSSTQHATIACDDVGGSVPCLNVEDAIVFCRVNQWLNLHPVLITCTSEKMLDITSMPLTSVTCLRKEMSARSMELTADHPYA